MSAKITEEHRRRGATIYVRQSTLGQVTSHTESQRRQYALADAARAMGFAAIAVIDEDLGRSGSGLVERPGFQRLVASVCAGEVGAVFCIEASRLARNGRDWHHLIDLCALVGTLVIDPDGVYEPRLINDRLLLGLKGTMSEYELSLLRQRGLEARDAKARRGALRFALPPGYCWNALGGIDTDPDERVVEAIALVFRKFRELGSARQVQLWARHAELMLPVMRQGPMGAVIEWQSPTYHRMLSILQHPMYAGAYVFGRTGSRTQMVEGRARKSNGHRKAPEAWSVLIKDHHPEYISWQEFEANQRLLAENAHMHTRTSRQSARGGRALLSGLVRCGRCGRMMRVHYGSRAGHAHRYQCRGDNDQNGTGLCIGIGGVRVDRAVVGQLLEAVSDHAIEAAIRACEHSAQTDAELRQARERELEEAQYEALLAERRYTSVDPTKRLVARELEARWNAALERVAELQERITSLARTLSARPQINRAALMALAQDLPAVWNAPGTDAATKQRLIHVLIEEVVLDLDDDSNEAIVTVHWVGGRHTELRIARVRTGRYPDDRDPSPVEVVRQLAGQWPDRELAVTMNRMRCKSSDGQSWTTVAVRQLRERLGIAPFDPDIPREATVCVDETAQRLGICVGSVHRLIGDGILPARQLMPSAPWQVPVAALDSAAVQAGVRAIKQRRPSNFKALQDVKTLRLPGL